MTILLRDANGESLSTSDRASAEAYDQALDLFNSYRADPVALLTPVLQRDPQFVSGQLLMAGLLLSAFDPRFFPMANDSCSRAMRSTTCVLSRSSGSAISTFFPFIFALMIFIKLS